MRSSRRRPTAAPPIGEASLAAEVETEAPATVEEPVTEADAEAALTGATLDPPKQSVRRPGFSDADLVRRARLGEVAAFEALYRIWHRRIYSFIYQQVGREAEAVDLTQDVFVKLYESLPTLRMDEAFVSFLYRMTINQCRDHYRRNSRLRVESLDQPRFGDDDTDAPAFEIADTTGDPHSLIEQDEKDRRLHAAIATLSEDHRTVIILHHFHEMELSDIARIMKCAEGTVKSRLGRAREELKRKLGGYFR